MDESGNNNNNNHNSMYQNISAESRQLWEQRALEHQQENQRFFDSLANDDVWLYLLCHFTTYVDIVNLSSVSKQFHKIAMTDKVMTAHTRTPTRTHH